MPGHICKFSPEAQALERVEFIVKTLRECFIRDNWRLDKHDAARVIQYFRWMAEGQPKKENDPEWDFVIKWTVKHGQWMDWILSGDPRCMIAAGTHEAVNKKGPERVKRSTKLEMSLS